MSYLFTPYQHSSFSYILKSSHPDKHHLPALPGILFILKVSNNLKMTICILFHGAYNYSFSHILRFSNSFITFILVSAQMTIRKIVLSFFIYLFIFTSYSFHFILWVLKHPFFYLMISSLFQMCSAETPLSLLCPFDKLPSFNPEEARRGYVYSGVYEATGLHSWHLEVAAELPFLHSCLLPGASSCIWVRVPEAWPLCFGAGSMVHFWLKSFWGLPHPWILDLQAVRPVHCVFL